MVSVREWDGERGAPGAELAGPESWRTSVYGSEAVRRRGARFLPRLADGDLIVEGADLPAFKAECEALLRDGEELAAEVDVRLESLKSRLLNLTSAADQAMLIGGTVLVS